jgi:gp16 family phage-associated protein
MIENASSRLRSEAEVRAEFARLGLSIGAWARAHGFSAQLVYQVLAGRKRALRGQSHEIAVRLGLKRGQIGCIEDIDALAVCNQPFRGGILK